MNTTELEATLHLQAPEAASPVIKPVPHLMYTVYTLSKLEGTRVDRPLKALTRPACFEK